MLYDCTGEVQCMCSRAFLPMFSCKVQGLSTCTQSPRSSQLQLIGIFFISDIPILALEMLAGMDKYPGDIQ